MIYIILRTQYNFDNIYYKLGKYNNIGIHNSNYFTVYIHNILNIPEQENISRFSYEAMENWV